MKVITNDLSFADLIALSEERLKLFLQSFLSNIPSPELKLAIEYTMGHGGKRVRPLLVYATGSIFDAPLTDLDGPAAAIELIHTFSLIHDDLPSMDNADLRRGKPSCHKEFGEAKAVLTGDALQTLAFQVLGTYPSKLPALKRLQMMNLLAEATGAYGMTAGQALDLNLMCDPTLSTELLFDIYRLKTGSLITASVLLGQIASTDDDDFNQKALKDFGASIGLAFQLQDDWLDMTQSTDILGKNNLLDAKNQKYTLAKRLGTKATQEKIESLYEKALADINYLGTKAQLLREVIAYLLQRNK